MTGFDAFVARKTQEAERADIHPLTTAADHRMSAELRGTPLAAIGNEWSRQMFDGPFYLSPERRDGLPATSLVFVRSRDGNTVAPDPSSLGGGDADKHLIYEGLSRAAADAVLGGAGTLHGGTILSTWHPELVALRRTLGLPRHPTQIVATRRGLPLDGRLMFNVPQLRVMFLTSTAGVDAMHEGLAARPWITTIVDDDLRAAFGELRRLGIVRLSCIGGRTLAAGLLDARLVQDLYLTTAAKPGGEPDTPFYSKPLGGREVVRKRGTGPDEGVTFEHVRLPV